MSTRSIFDDRTEEDVVRIIEQVGIPGLRQMNLNEADLERVLDLIETHFNTDSIVGGKQPERRQPQQEAQKEDEKEDQKEAEEEDGAVSKGKLLSDEDRAKLDALEPQLAKKIAEAKADERRQQIEAWKRIQNKGVIPIKFKSRDEAEPEVVSLAKRKVLFICQDNSCLSQLAEAWCFHAFHEILDCASAGLTAAKHIDKLAAAVMLKHDIDICQWRTKDLEFVRDVKFDIICPLDDASHLAAKDRDWKGGKIIGGQFQVPEVDDTISEDEAIAHAKAQRAIQEWQRRADAGEEIAFEDMLKEPGLEERLEKLDLNAAETSGLTQDVRLMPAYSGLSNNILRFIESIPQILAYLDSDNSQKD